MKTKNGKIVPFLFDLGSNCSLVEYSVLILFNGKYKDCMLSLKRLGGNTILCKLQVTVMVEIQGIFLKLVLCIAQVSLLEQHIFHIKVIIYGLIL